MLARIGGAVLARGQLGTVGYKPTLHDQMA